MNWKRPLKGNRASGRKRRPAARFASLTAQ